MAAPTINIGSTKFLGNVATITGTVDPQGNTITAQLFIHSVPESIVLGPFAVAITSNAFSVPVPLGVGDWRARVVVTPTSGTAVEQSSNTFTMARAECKALMPLRGGGDAAPVVFTHASIDPATSLTFTAALVNGAIGSKRVAGAGHLISAIGSTPRLHIYQNGELIIAANYSTPLVLVNTAGSVRLVLGTLQDANILTTGDLAEGHWTFAIQGGTNFTREIRGTVGDANSSYNMKLSHNPTVGASFVSEFALEIPASVDA